MPTYKYTLKDGKVLWYANFYYTDWTGKKQHVCKRGFKAQRDAKEYERLFIDKQGVSCDILFSSLVENYMKDMHHRLKPTTMENKEFLINGKILPYFKKLKLNEIDTIKIRKWQDEMLSYRDENGNSFAPTYLKTINNQISAILNYAVKHYNLASNPCRAAGSIGKSKADEMNFWTLDEFNVFIACVNKQRLKLAYDILFYTGIRSGELLALAPEDILPTKEIWIRKNFEVVKKVEYIMEPKTERGKRKISIPDFLYNDIQRYISKLYGIQSTDRLFYMTRNALEAGMKRYSAKAGLEPIRVHDLRHSNASLLINMHIDIMEISRRLGHESVKVTLDTYGHLYPNKEPDLAERLNAFRDVEKNNEHIPQNDVDKSSKEG